MTRKKKIEKIESIIAHNRLIKDRVEQIEKIKIKCEERPMGPGGVGQIKTFPVLKQTFMQIGCGHGRCNYAMCASI